MKWISVERSDKVIFSLQEMTEFWDTHIETTRIAVDWHSVSINKVRRIIISKAFEVVLVDTEQRQLGVRRQLLEVGPGELLRRHAAAPLVAVPHLQYSCQRHFQPQFQQEKGPMRGRLRAL